VLLETRQKFRKSAHLFHPCKGFTLLNNKRGEKTEKRKLAHLGREENFDWSWKGDSPEKQEATLREERD